MTHISKRKLNSEITDHLNNSLVFLIKELSSKGDVEKFLNSIVTETERLMISKRVVAAFFLKHNIAERDIAETLKLTPATVSRLKLWIQTRQSNFDTVFDKLEKEERFKIAKNLFYILLKYVINAAGGKTPKVF